ncbi:MAG TPA: tetratricopeptide repeat protein, partial [Planctomycetota bacterium]|nr:tetratricopeptide repeat protein [Planctomycetota bacterium]
PSAGAAVAVAALIEPLLRGRRTDAAGPGLAPAGMLVVLVLGGALGLRTIERNRDFETTEKLFAAAKEAVPDSARVHYQLGVLHARQKLFTKAEEHFIRALQIDPGFLQAAIGVGDVYTGDRNWDKAITVYNDILKRIAPTQHGTPEQFDAISNLVLRNRSLAKAGKGDVEGSRADLEAAMRVAHENPAAHLQLAQMLIAREQYAEAIPILRSALQLAPQDVSALYELARAAAAVDDTQAYDEAVAGLAQTEAGKPSAVVLEAEKLYQEAARENDPDKQQQALDLFDQARKLQPGLATPYIYRARYLIENGRLADAILDLDRALERAPRHPTALLLKGVALNTTNRPAEALPVLEELRTVNPNILCWMALAETHARLGQIDEMGAAFAEIGKLGGEPTDVVEERASQLESAGRYDDAIAVVEQARALPDYARHPILLRRLGILLTRAARYEEALSTFDQQAQAELEQTEVEPDAFLPINRFRALLPLGRFDEASRELERFAAAAQPGTYQWPSLLHRRAELLLAVQDGRTNPYYDPAEAARLADEGIEATQSQYAAMYDVSIEALVASDRLAEAVARAEDARSRFPGDRHFQAAAVALKLAAEGGSADQRTAAIEQLRK